MSHGRAFRLMGSVIAIVTVIAQNHSSKPDTNCYCYWTVSYRASHVLRQFSDLLCDLI
jgi:hypothetical protein